jgi:DMSO reductase family type II enzyme heme b subunit
MSDLGQTPNPAKPRSLVILGRVLIAILLLLAVAQLLLIRQLSKPATIVPQFQRVQHVPAPPEYVALQNPFLDPQVCVELKAAGPDAVQVREIVRSAVTNRTDHWAGRLLEKLPRLITESVSRERADELVAAITAAGGEASARDALDHFVELAAGDRETPIGRPSELLDVEFLRSGRDAIADLREALARGGPASVSREQALAAFVAFTTAEGRVLYQTNCRPCHGTKASGDGPMSAAWSLPPANFRASDMIAALTSGELLWRIEAGAPGLPDSATPWDSSMPAWKYELDRELVWKIILGEYNTANVAPSPLPLSPAAGERGRGEGASASRDSESSWLDWPVPQKPSAEKTRDPEFVTRGKYIYSYRCMPCHGISGRGDGPAANTMWPRPRDFTDIKVGGFDDQRRPPTFKFRTTRYGWLPTDEDLYRTISRGLTGTAMEGWDGVLDAAEIWQTIAYLKTFSAAWNDPDHIAKNPNDPVVVKEYTEPGVPGPLFDFDAMTPPAITPQLIADGAEAFKKIGCWQCHGVEARGDGSALGQHYDVWDYRQWPQNLTNPMNFKAGNSIKEIYRDIVAGLDGSVMPIVTPESLEPKDPKRGEYLRWAIAGYVASNVETAAAGASSDARSAVVIARRAADRLPSEPLDPRWDVVPAAFVPLTGQVVAPPRWPAPSVNQVAIKALISGDRADADSRGTGSLAIWLRWDDRRPNLEHQEPAADLEPADPESLGPKTYRFPALKPKAPVVFACRDQLELQWPAGDADSVRRPYVLYGDEQHPVVLWRWHADRQGLNVRKEIVKIGDSQAERLVCAPAELEDAPVHQAVEELVARGLASQPVPLSTQPQVRSVAHWSNGAWTVVLSRALHSDADSDVSFAARSGERSASPIVPFAVHVWDGLAGEGDGRFAASSWVYLAVEQPVSRSLIFVLIAGVVLALILAIALVLWYRGRIGQPDRNWDRS